MEGEGTDIDWYGDGETTGDYPNVTEGNMEEDDGGDVDTIPDGDEIGDGDGDDED